MSKWIHSITYLSYCSWQNETFQENMLNHHQVIKRFPRRGKFKKTRFVIELSSFQGRAIFRQILYTMYCLHFKQIFECLLYHKQSEKWTSSSEFAIALQNEPCVCNQWITNLIQGDLCQFAKPERLVNDVRSFLCLVSSKTWCLLW